MKLLPRRAPPSCSRPGVLCVCDGRRYGQNERLCAQEQADPDCGLTPRSADIACRRLAELSRSGNEAPPAGLASKVPDGSDPSTLAWPSRCPAALRRRHRHPAAQRSWSRSFAPGDTFLAGTPVCVRRFDRTARRRWRAGVLDAVRRRDGRSGGDRVIAHEIAVCQRISHNRMSVPQLARSRLSGLKAIPLTSRR